MGWNDHYDPSEYDPADPDSMRALADRAIRDSAKATPDTTPEEEKGECWDCGAKAKLYGSGMCGRCYVANKY